MFGKAKCKLCGDSVRFALRHPKRKTSGNIERQRCDKIEYVKDNGKIFQIRLISIMITIYNVSQLQAQLYS